MTRTGTALVGGLLVPAGCSAGDDPAGRDVVAASAVPGTGAGVRVDVGSRPAGSSTALQPAGTRRPPTSPVPVLLPPPPAGTIPTTRPVAGAPASGRPGT